MRNRIETTQGYTGQMINETEFSRTYTNGSDSSPLAEPTMPEALAPPWRIWLRKLWFRKGDFTMTDGRHVVGGTLVPKWAMPTLLAAALAVGITIISMLAGERQNRLIREAVQDKAAAMQKEADDKAMAALNEKLRQLMIHVELSDSSSIDAAMKFNMVVGYITAKNGASLKLEPIPIPKKLQDSPQGQQEQ